VTWADLDPEIRAVAEQVCTPRELEAFRYSESGWGYRRIGEWMDIRWETARDRVKEARKKIAKRQEQIREEREAA
jgi:predicted DNA-binding protein (UPF0251 family)